MRWGDIVVGCERCISGGIQRDSTRRVREKMWRKMCQKVEDGLKLQWDVLGDMIWNKVECEMGMG